jgi:diguanylate cyclase (GGDEF)-like protein/PAS domain S-box-containing protein
MTIHSADGQDAPDDRTSPQELRERLLDAERRAFEADAKYEALLKQLPAVIYVYSPELDGPTLHMSPYVEELLGVPPEAFLEDPDIWDKVIHPEDRDRARLEYEWFLRTGKPEFGEFRYLRPDGSVVWVRDHSALIRGEDGTPLFVQGVMTDITLTKQVALRMQHLAFHDPLTGLPNRTMFEQHLSLALARARRDHLAVAVVFLDLDAFKPVNDIHGHATGDQVLRQLSARLQHAVREADIVARQGGDEFLILVADLPIGANGEETHAAVAWVIDRLREEISVPFRMRTGELTLRASVGYALYPMDAAEGAELLLRADEAMYEHKRSQTDPPTPMRWLA